MAEAAMMEFQLMESARESERKSDLEFAYELQLNEALAASAVTTEIPSNSKSKASQERASSGSQGRGGGDRGRAWAKKIRKALRPKRDLVGQEKEQKAQKSMDQEFAYQLQLNEALAASNVMTQIPSSSSSSKNEAGQASNSSQGGDKAVAWAEQTRELRRDGDLEDQEKAEKTLDQESVYQLQLNEALAASVNEDCPICLESTPVARMFVVRNCSHKFCLDCLSQHMEVQVKEKQVPVRCPVECFNCLELDQCEPFLPPKVLELYAKCLIEAEIPESDRVYCPFPNCSALMSKAGLNASHMGSSSTHPHVSSIRCCQCMECHGLFCVECQVPWHGDLSCAAYQTVPPDGRDAEDIKLDHVANSKKWPRCNKCHIEIELDQDCYHMICRCGHEFCCSCGAEWKDKHATCKCKLWDDGNIVWGRG